MLKMLYCCTYIPRSLSLSDVWWKHGRFCYAKKNSQTQSNMYFKTKLSLLTVHTIFNLQNILSVSVCLSSESSARCWWRSMRINRNTHSPHAVCVNVDYELNSDWQMNRSSYVPSLSNTNHQQTGKYGKLFLCEQFIPMYLNLSGAFKAQLHSAVQTVNNNLVYLYTVLFWALKALYIVRGVSPHPATSVQHPPGWCDGSQ